jgi:hypothetical protein
MNVVADAECTTVVKGILCAVLLLLATIDHIN